MVRGRTTDEVGEIGELQVGCRGWGNWRCGRFCGLSLGLAFELDQEGSGLLGREFGLGLRALRGTGEVF